MVWSMHAVADITSQLKRKQRTSGTDPKREQDWLNQEQDGSKRERDWSNQEQDRSKREEDRSDRKQDRSKRESKIDQLKSKIDQRESKIDQIESNVVRVLLRTLVRGHRCCMWIPFPWNRRHWNLLLRGTTCHGDVALMALCEKCRPFPVHWKVAKGYGLQTP